MDDPNTTLIPAYGGDDELDLYLFLVSWDSILYRFKGHHHDDPEFL
jgi:hypothetical protein